MGYSNFISAGVQKDCISALILAGLDERNEAVVRSPSGETFVAPAQSPSPANNATPRMNELTPPVDTAELDDHVPSRLVTLLVSVRSPCAMTDVERRAVIASGMRVNMVIRVGGW